MPEELSGFRTPTFYDGRQQLHDLPLSFAFGLIGMTRGIIEGGGPGIGQGAHGFDLALHGHHHATHIGVVDNAYSFAALHPDRPALRPLP